MALQINENITSREGVALNSFYIRLEPLVLSSGRRIIVDLLYYSSKDAFKYGLATIKKKDVLTLEYDRIIDGVDIIDFCHRCVIENLTKTEGVNESNNYLFPSYDINNITITGL